MIPVDVVDSLRLPFFFLDLEDMMSALGALEPWEGRLAAGDEDAVRGSVKGSRAKLGCGVVHMSREGLFAVITGYLWRESAH